MKEVISSEDPEKIKKRRSAIQSIMKTIQNCLAKILAKSAGKFDYDKIKRLLVQGEHADLKKHLESFKMIHEAYLQYREVGNDTAEEGSLVEKQEQHYDEVVEKVYESFRLVADYEESYQLYKTAQPNPELAKKEAEEKASKEALDK